MKLKFLSDQHSAASGRERSESTSSDENAATDMATLNNEVVIETGHRLQEMAQMYGGIQELDQVYGGLSHLSDELEFKEAELKKTLDELDIIEEEVKDLKNVIREKEEHEDKLRRNNDELHQQLIVLQRKLQVVEEDRDSKMTEWASMRLECDSLKEKIADLLEEKVDFLRPEVTNIRVDECSRWESFIQIATCGVVIAYVGFSILILRKVPNGIKCNSSKH